MLPKLSKIIRDTVYSSWDVVEHRPNSFELFGFDFVLDHRLNPWLIEVNLSPACCERTDWLVDMLRTFCEPKSIEHMSDGIIELVEPRLPPVADPTIQTHLPSPYRWIKIYDMREELCHSLVVAYQNSKGNPEIEICGRKVNVKAERRVEKAISASWAIPIIQRNIRFASDSEPR